jgi:UDP-glucuronate 4-epimerase
VCVRVCVNSYQARAKELLSLHGIVVQRVDVCDDRLVHRTMTTHHVTHVVHLAAQAGIRYSVKDPIAYVTANVECFTKLLIVLDEFPVCIITSRAMRIIYYCKFIH